MDKSFQFIDGSKSDRATRRLALSHVMKGKNLGKTHSRPSRLGVRSQQNVSLTRHKANIVGRDVEQASCFQRNRVSADCLGRQLFSVPFPIETTAQSRHIVDQFFTFYANSWFPSRLCLSVDQFKLYWLRQLFADLTSYHCSMALMGSLNDFFFGSSLNSSPAIYHLSRAVSLVKEKLKTPDALLNTNLSVVNFMILRELMREDKPAAEVHRLGLEKMVRLRGGLPALDDEILAWKICKTDLDYALHYGTPTLFHHGRLLEASQILASSGFDLSRIQSHVKLTQPIRSPLLQGILSDVLAVSKLLGEADGAPIVEARTFQELVVSLGYRLIMYRPLLSPRFEGSTTDSAYHIGLVVFLTTMFSQLGRRRFLKYQLVAQCLRYEIDRGLEGLDQNLVLWLLLIGGISVLAEVDDEWLDSSTRRVVRALRIESWSQARKHINLYPWISGLHDADAETLWNRVERIQV